MNRRRTFFIKTLAPFCNSNSTTLIIPFEEARISDVYPSYNPVPSTEELSSVSILTSNNVKCVYIGNRNRLYVMMPVILHLPEDH